MKQRHSSTPGFAALATGALAAAFTLAGSSHAAGAAENGGLAASTAALPKVTVGTVIRNVTVVDTRSGALAPRMNVLILGGKVMKITPFGFNIGGHATTIDGSGNYLVPGYLDMHTHAVPSADAPAPYWPLLIANGITGIRDMAGSPELLARARQLNSDSAAGRVDAPEVLMIPGPILANITTPEAGVQAVQQQKAMGVDFIKLVSAERNSALAVLAEAKAQGLTVAGHLPIGLSAFDAAKAGWRAVEHEGAGLGLGLDCSSEADSIRADLLAGKGSKPVPSPLAVVSPMLFRGADAPFFQRAIDSFDPIRCAALMATLARHDTWQALTLIRLHTGQDSTNLQYRQDPNLAYVDKTTRALWESLAVQFANTVPAEASATFLRYYDYQRKLVPLMKRHGVKILAGSDLGGIWVIPGFSLHQEFGELAAAGLTPLEVLQSTTLNGAKFLKREATMGTVDEGKNADLVLLEANPIESAAHLDRIAGVFLKGRYFPKDKLEQMKRETADAHAAQPVRAMETVLDPTHVH